MPVEGAEPGCRVMREIDVNAVGSGGATGASGGGVWGAVHAGMDVNGTKVRVLQTTVEELKRAVEELRQRMQESAALERQVRVALGEARGRERAAAQRLAAEGARVHALEIMRMNGTYPGSWCMCVCSHLDRGKRDGARGPGGEGGLVRGARCVTATVYPYCWLPVISRRA